MTGSGGLAGIVSGLIREIAFTKRRTGHNSDVLECRRYCDGDGFKSWPEAAPFDAIILTCARLKEVAPEDSPVLTPFLDYSTNSNTPNRSGA
ncbi:hypothetical protein SBV1_630002 [Verrucomicrobia bacterium]|nr:hypothetical protein SBV1_630002 [Verrucomicrobiota bacterium]